MDRPAAEQSVFFLLAVGCQQCAHCALNLSRCLCLPAGQQRAICHCHHRSSLRSVLARQPAPLGKPQAPAHLHTLTSQSNMQLLLEAPLKAAQQHQAFSMPQYRQDFKRLVSQELPSFEAAAACGHCGYKSDDSDAAWTDFLSYVQFKSLARQLPLASLCALVSDWIASPVYLQQMFRAVCGSTCMCTRLGCCRNQLAWQHLTAPDTADSLHTACLLCAQHGGINGTASCCYHCIHTARADVKQNLQKPVAWRARPGLFAWSDTLCGTTRRGRSDARRASSVDLSQTHRPADAAAHRGGLAEGWWPRGAVGGIATRPADLA